MSAIERFHARVRELEGKMQKDEALYANALLELAARLEAVEAINGRVDTALNVDADRMGSIEARLEAVESIDIQASHSRTG